MTEIPPVTEADDEFLCDEAEEEEDGIPLEIEADCEDHGACGALTDHAAFLALAEDAARAVRPADAIETMMAQQLAAAHTVAMRLADRAMALSEVPDKPSWQLLPKDGPHDREAARVSQSAVRLMGAFRSGVLALDRVRNGNRLTITVDRTGA